MDCKLYACKIRRNWTFKAVFERSLQKMKFKHLIKTLP